MKLFKTVRVSFGRLGIYPLQFAEKFDCLNSKNVMLIIIMNVFVVLSIMYLLNECKTMMDYTASVYTIATANIFSILLAILVWKSSKIFELIENLENFIEKRMTDPIKQAIYEDTIASVEKWTALMDFFMAKFTIPFAITLNLTSVVVTNYTADLTDEDYVLAHLIWFPFNWKTIPGYLVANFFLLVFGVCGLQVVSCTFCLLLGSYFLLKAITKDIKEDLLSMDQHWKRNQDRVQIRESFGEFIENLADAVQFVGDLAKNLKYVFTVYALWGIVTICSTLLMLNSDEISEAKMSDVFIMVFKMFYSYGLIDVYCELCEQISNGFEDILDTTHQLEWYTYPMEIQRMLPIILNHAQQPVEIVSFGNIVCSRETFKQIANKGYTFFTVFREM